MRQHRRIDREGPARRGGRRAAALALALVLPLAGAAAAGGPTPDTTIGRLYLSRLLAAHAEATGDPLALVAAARIRAGAGGSLGLSALGDGGDPFAPEALLDRAEGLTGPSDPLAALIRQTRREIGGGGAMRLDFEAPRSETRRIGPGGTDAIGDVAFARGAFAEVYVEGDGQANLDLFVRADGGVIVCSDTDPSSISFCGWHNTEPVVLTIEVRNLGAVASRYRLFVQ